MTDPAAQRRRPRFERSTPPAFELTERDIAILREIARHRLLRSDHISALLDAPHKKICNRLAGLFHAGFLDRPRAQIVYHVKGGGSRPLAYSIGTKALPFIAHRTRHAHGVNSDIGRMFLDHTLAVADFRVALRLAVRRQTAWRLVETDELSALRATTHIGDQFAWHVSVAGGVSVAVVPDHVFALRHVDGRTRNYLVEIDRGTMPILRSSLRQSSVMRKLLAYDALRRGDLLLRDLGWRNFRVLILTGTRARADNILSAIARSSLAASPLFLVTDTQGLAATDVLASRWRDAGGVTHTFV